MVQAILDSQALGLVAELKAVGLKKEEADVLTTLDAKHQDYLNYEQVNFLSKSHLGSEDNAPNSACKSVNFQENKCKFVLKSNEKKCAGNTAVTSGAGETVSNTSDCDSSDKTYTYDMMKKIVGDFLVKDYAYDGVQVLADKAAMAYKKAESTLDTETFSIKLVCDEKKWTFTEYDDLECKADKPKELSAKWGDCVQGPDGGYIKMTGAIALKAAAAALVAFAGSQF